MVKLTSSPPSGRQQLPAIQFSEKELSIQKQKQASKIASLSILGTLATLTCALGITLSIIFANPLFLVLFIATALFAVVAAITYLHLTAVPSSNWQRSLEENFNKIPPQVASRDFLTTQGNFSFYQSTANPGIKLGIQGDSSTPFAPVLLATFKGLKSQKKEGMIFNVINPKDAKISNVSTNLSGVLYPTALKHGDWHRCDTRNGERTATAFFPGEARSTPYTEYTKSVPPTIKKEQIPSHLGHVRGPGVDEFPAQDEKAAEAYYLRALFAYEASLEAALEAGVNVVALPLFSSTYEVPQQEKAPRAGGAYEWPMECNLFCKKALIEAVGNLARSNPRARLLILLQDPFSSLAETSTTASNTQIL